MQHYNLSYALKYMQLAWSREYKWFWWGGSGYSVINQQFISKKLNKVDETEKLAIIYFQAYTRPRCGAIVCSLQTFKICRSRYPGK